MQANPEIVAYSRPWLLGLFQLPRCLSSQFPQFHRRETEKKRDTTIFDPSIISSCETSTSIPLPFPFPYLWRHNTHRAALCRLFTILILICRVALIFTRPFIYPTTALSDDTKDLEVVLHSTQSTHFADSTRLSFINLAGPAAPVVHLFNCFA